MVPLHERWGRRDVLLAAAFVPMLFIPGCGGGGDAEVSGVKKVKSLTITDLGTLGGATSAAAAINARGQVIGFSKGADGATHGFLWQNGVMTDLGIDATPTAINDAGEVTGFISDQLGTRSFVWQGGVLTVLVEAQGLSDCRPRKINNKGQVVGVCGKLPEWGAHAFFWDSGVMTDLGQATALDVNESGEVTGEVYGLFGSSYEDHAYFWNGVMTDLGTLGVEPPAPASSSGYAINNRGQVAGTTSTASGYRAFLWNNGVMTNLGTLPSATDSYATAINNAGEVAGSSAGRAFIWKNGLMTDLGVLPGRSWSSPVAINDQGSVIGYCYSYSSTGYTPDLAFIWQSGVMTELTGRNGAAAEPVAINAKGDIAGTSGGHAILWSIR